MADNSKGDTMAQEKDPIPLKERFLWSSSENLCAIADELERKYAQEHEAMYEPSPHLKPLAALCAQGKSSEIDLESERQELKDALAILGRHAIGR